MKNEWIDKIKELMYMTVQLGYNEQLGTDQICSL